MTAREPPCRLVRRFYGEVGKTLTGRAVSEIGAIFGGGVTSIQGDYSHILAQSKKTTKTIAISKENGLATTAILVQKTAVCEGRKSSR